MTESKLRLRNPRINIIPIWIVLLDKLNLPGTTPLLQSLFAEDSLLDIVELLEVNQAMNPILLGETLNQPLPMLIHSSNQIVGDADIERATNPARQDVDPVAP